MAAYEHEHVVHHHLTHMRGAASSPCRSSDAVSRSRAGCTLCVGLPGDADAWPLSLLTGRSGLPAAAMQEVAGPSAGALQGLTNSCSILVGIAGTLWTGVVVEQGSYCAVFGAMAAAYAAAAVIWAGCLSDVPVGWTG